MTQRWIEISKIMRSKCCFDIKDGIRSRHALAEWMSITVDEQGQIVKVNMVVCANCKSIEDVAEEGRKNLEK